MATQDFVTPSVQPLPVVDPDSAPFWDAARERSLVVQRCSRCSTMRFPPSPICGRCRSWETEWVEIEGAGTVYSWVTIWHAVTDGLAGQVPYIVALVDLEPGVRMPTRLLGCAPEEVSDGMPVSVSFIPLTDDITLPVFEADRSGAAASH